MVAYCHCRFCQLATGAPLNAAAVYQKTAVRYFGDEPKMYTSSVIAVSGHFVATVARPCSPYTTPRMKADFYAIRLATMDNLADFPPTVHYGVESQVPWLDINDDLPRIRADDDPEMQRRWAAVGRPDPTDQLPTSVSDVSRDSDTKDGSK